MEYVEFENFAIDLAKSAGEEIMSFYGKIKNVKNKSSDIDLVTEADTNSENIIIESIKQKFSNHDILSEESENSILGSDFCWVIDPLDGTTNFVHKLPIFAVSIALQYKNQTVVGVVYNPVYNQCFHASLNNGARLNNLPINVSSTSILSSSLLVTGFPYNKDEMWESSFEIFRDFYFRNQGIRRLGAAALDLCFVAMGRFDGFYEFNLNPWDICAGELIVREANGKTSDWDGVSIAPFSGRRILASNKLIHTQMSDILMQKKYTEIFMN